ncbi:DUF421 domain-containing protein [Niallia sp. XMNu-256]|uniref:DUF421 domain-containing protein n=1 Tax=Niallia sp. XMNu-256 TaxID=3082444 RepID=UPI0030D58DFF
MLTNIISEPVEVHHTGKAIAYSGVIVLLYKLFVRLSLNNTFRWVLYESPTVLIRNGDIDRNGLKKVRMPMNELLSQLRVKGFTDTRNIAMAIMEETGNLSVIPKSAYRPLQPIDLNLKVNREYLPIPLIMDGQIIHANLKYLQLDQNWLLNEVKKRGGIVKNIMLATFLENGKLYIDNNGISDHEHDPYYYDPGKDH